MTVCAAAVYLDLGEGGRGFGIFTISDRMLTDSLSWRTSEPLEDKVFPLTATSRLLTAGDIFDHRPLWEAANQLALERRPLQAIVAAYQAEYFRARESLAELRYLRPHGLTMATWSERQKNMKTPLVMSIAQQLEQPLLEVTTIICGFEERQPEQLSLPHLWTIVDFGRLTVHDTEGFAAIGAGANALATDLRISGYVRTWDRARTLRALYAAKKTAESISSVGRITDLFEITPTETHNRGLWVADLDRISQRERIRAAKSASRAEQETHAFLKSVDDNQ